MGAEKLKPQEIKIEVTLIPAIAEDLKEISHYRTNNHTGEKVKVMKLRNGFPFWLLSPNTGEIEPIPYILNDRTLPADIARYLEDGTIYMSKQHQ